MREFLLKNSEMVSDIRCAAKGFQQLGLRRFHGVGMMGHNCPEWFISNAGAVYGGGLVRM